MGGFGPPIVVVVVWGGALPLLIVRRDCPNAGDPGFPPSHQSARGGRDRGGVNPPRGPSRSWDMQNYESNMNKILPGI